jgi:hypothetical protein
MVVRGGRSWSDRPMFLMALLTRDRTAAPDRDPRRGRLRHPVAHRAGSRVGIEAGAASLRRSRVTRRGHEPRGDDVRLGP